MSHSRLLFCLLLAALGLTQIGCLTTEKTFELPCTVLSEPEGAKVEYRLVRKPHDELTPIQDPWIYLGRTPYKGEAEVPQKLLKSKENKLLLRVSKPGYYPVYKEYKGSLIDLESGLAADARLVSFAEQARKEKMKK